MNKTLVLAALAVSMAAASAASAQTYQQSKGGFDRAYQEELLRRSLSQADAGFCEGKKADACKVTRLYLADIAQSKEKGFPPLADPEYARTEAEETQLLDRLP